ncbi:MauE/DoxX family redox-associated membrane protein [Chitinophaga niabensis]|uniref:DoxX-like family protein n=1 Tax=Chitinophaga niabensis TaxID=536979 RepID=A0A1N6JYY1_9BACT|nr:MauE/DoxX family redox-associated membrane protein [Chitinophaga niabensis]SIO49337.1 DoxX-like family protein [Chitinophaga niabensis]
MKISKIIIELIAALLIVLWIYTGLNKMMDYSTFKTQLGRSPFIQSLAGFIAIALPVGEIILASLLVFKKTRKLGLYLSFGLMFLFTGYIWLMLNYAYDLPCSCGGVLAKLSWGDHLIFNSGFTILSLIGIILSEIYQTALLRKERILETKVQL